MIKLTGPDGEEVWIRPDAVHVVRSNTVKAAPGSTQLGFSGPGSALLVSESVQEVLDKLHRRSTEWK